MTENGWREEVAHLTLWYRCTDLVINQYPVSRFILSRRCLGVWQVICIWYPAYLVSIINHCTCKQMRIFTQLTALENDVHSLCTGVHSLCTEGSRSHLTGVLGWGRVHSLTCPCTRTPAYDWFANILFIADNDSHGNKNDTGEPMV